MNYIDETSLPDGQHKWLTRSETALRLVEDVINDEIDDQTRPQSSGEVRDWRRSPQIARPMKDAQSVIVLKPM